MPGRGSLICGKSAGGCTEVTLQPPLLRSTVLPEWIIAAMLPWQPACRPGSMPSCVPTNSNTSPCFLSLQFREVNRAYYQSCRTGVSLPLVLQMGTTALPITLPSCPHLGHHKQVKHEVESRGPQAAHRHSKVCPITARRKLHPHLGMQGTLHNNSWL